MNAETESLVASAETYRGLISQYEQLVDEYQAEMGRLADLLKNVTKERDMWRDMAQRAVSFAESQTGDEVDD
ncbi:hypothetical protein [Rhodococcus aetherivorans]|uniref:hypothetical protein n=1 Tax=Rhodococcus aetherivorans TaxID=191292 RepID=UPI00241E2AD9|nr:hypothetical protein [Rhodococcus aetherivorans]WFS13807.1 hypothetical protein P9K37_01420 [Rhodococcus aetherivorans]